MKLRIALVLVLLALATGVRADVPAEHRIYLPMVVSDWYPEVAPARTYMPVGSVARYADSSISFTGVVAGLQTLVIIGITIPQYILDFFPAADFRLVQGDNYASGYVLIGVAYPYDNDYLIFTIPSYIGPGCANKLVLYDPDGEQVIAEAWFDSSGIPPMPEPDPWPGEPPVLPEGATMQDEVSYWVARAAEWEAR